MLIHVMRTGSHFDYIKDFLLNDLIEKKGIIKFKRSTGWTTIGTDPIRGTDRNAVFIGTDRRALAV